MKVGAFYEATAELKGFHRRNSFAHGTNIGTPPLTVERNLGSSNCRSNDTVFR